MTKSHNKVTTISDSMMETLRSTLARARERLDATSDSARLDAEILLGQVLQTSRASLYANPDKPITDRQAEEFAQLINQRRCGRPIAQLTGRKEFWSLELSVTPDVLVPRPETELLVERTLQHIPESGACDVVDLGCGSGAIAIAIAVERPNCNVTATDVSAAAIRIAQENAAVHCAERIEFLAGSWLEPLADRKFAVIVSNPPYVATGQPQLTDPELDHEPPLALYSGADGLDAIRVLIDQAPEHLHSGGYLLLEHGFDQADTIAALLKEAGFINIATHRDLADIPRMTEAQINGRG